MVGSSLGCLCKLCSGICRRTLSARHFRRCNFRCCNWLSDWSSIPNSSSRFCIDKECVMNPVLIVGVLFISAFLSGIAVFFVRRDNANALKLILSFSGAYLFSITVLHLIPHIYHTH